MKSIPDIKSEVDRLAAIIGATGHPSLPTYGFTRDAGYSHVEVDSRGYHLVTVERGEELERITTKDLDDLLYHIFENVTSSLAGEYELAHRIKGQDFRRIYFQKRFELLSQLSPRWGERGRQKIQDTLRASPFDDLSEDRVALAIELGQAGHPQNVVEQMIFERYPLPLPNSLYEYRPAPAPEQQPPRTIQPSHTLPAPTPRAVQFGSPPKTSLLVNPAFLGRIGFILFGMGLLLLLLQWPTKTSGFGFLCCSIWILWIAWALRPAAQQNKRQGKRWVMHALVPVFPVAIWYVVTRRFPDVDEQKTNRNFVIIMLIVVALLLVGVMLGYD
jgi:Immunity protein 63